jgi:hypothetical protein
VRGRSRRRTKAGAARASAARALIERGDASLLETVDHLLNKGVVITGDLLLGLADVDLVYLRLSALIAASDRVLPARRLRE